MAQFNLSITLEYELAVATHRLQLVEEVRRWIADGWQPLGGPFVHEGDLIQAMVREKPKESIDHTTYWLDYYRSGTLYCLDT